MLLSHHSSFRKAVHGWSCYELWEKGNVCIGNRHSHTVRRGAAAGIGRNGTGNRYGHGANVMHGSRSKGFNLRRSARRVPTAMNNGVANAFVCGIGENGVGIHEPAQFKYGEHNRNDHPDHQCGFHETLAALTAPSSVHPWSHANTGTSWKLGDEISNWLAKLR